MSILSDRLAKDKQYHAEVEERVESLAALKPSEEESKIANDIVRKVSEQFAARIASNGLTDQIKAAITNQVDKDISDTINDYEQRTRIRRLVLTSMFGLGPLETYLKPSSTVTDIVVQRFDSICIADETGMHKVEAQFNSEEHLRDVIQRIVQQVGRQINLSTPTVDARLQDGSRVHATIPPISPDGATLTIRRFNDEKLTADDYLRLGTLDRRILTFLALSVQAKLNILVSGGTSSGKTTLLNMLSGYIPEDELIITVEDNCELRLRQPNVRRLEAREASGEMPAIDIQRLIKETLRMRPDRIIVGETRDGSVVDMFTAMSTGHEGSMSTIHTDSPAALIDSRLPLLFSMYSGGTFSEETQRYMTAEALQLIVQINREANSTRRITSVTAVDGLDPLTKRIRLKALFRYNGDTDDFSIVGTPPDSILARFRKHHISIPDWVFDAKKEVDV